MIDWGLRQPKFLDCRKALSGLQLVQGNDDVLPATPCFDLGTPAALPDGRVDKLWKGAIAKYSKIASMSAEVSMPLSTRAIEWAIGPFS